MKRLFDTVVSAVALIVLSPIFLLLALGVWLSDPGPVLFRGQRMGLGARPFAILKFRSMRRSPVAGRQITVKGDPRITPFGRVLRKTKLDELPQLINVLRGDMSLVGPRPESPAYAPFYTPQEWAVLSVRPGLTGMAQIYFRNEEGLLRGSDPERYYREVILPTKLAFDLEYVHNQSFWLDLKLLVLTAVALVWTVAPPPVRQPTEPNPIAARTGT
jgi:lipopolysaccharide/colanic/teichoic acid biosynthesis glycosyltransferase